MMCTMQGQGQLQPAGVSMAAGAGAAAVRRHIHTAPHPVCRQPD